MYHVIINPGSRSGKTLALWEKKVKPAIDETGISYQTYFSNKEDGLAGIATQLEKENPQGDICCILLGGDGSLNEFIQGFTDISRLVLGLIQCGSGNDLARDLALPKNPTKAIRQILQNGTLHPMDLGEVRFPDGAARYFVTSTGVGFDAAVCEEVEHSKLKTLLNKIGLGKLVYLGVALKQIFGIKPFSCQLTLNEGVPANLGKSLFIAGMNHRYEGGGFQFCPKADCTDGSLDLCLVGSLPRWFILLVLPTAFFGLHTLFPRISNATAECYHVACDVPTWIHTDGEAVRKEKSFDVVCHKKAFQMLY